jgi:hypothetical protein
MFLVDPISFFQALVTAQKLPGARVTQFSVRSPANCFLVQPALFLSRRIQGSSFSRFLPCFRGGFFFTHGRCSMKCA